MSGVYGDFLLAFPEQLRSITVYSMTANINGGWTIVDGSSQTIKGIYQDTGGERLQDSNGNLAFTNAMELWTSTKGLNGMFTTIGSYVYRLCTNNDWTNEGGFARYGLQKVVGNNGTESESTSWNTGSNNFG